ncbi:MAG: hypothetical protein C5B43_04745 [Verrucomicrobia bacterium]|nr:MAG: hypothetical protein C5B43_04745 [Verrucomicrobiota bacterium]
MSSFNIRKLSNLFLGIALFAVPLLIWAGPSLTINNMTTDRHIQLKDIEAGYRTWLSEWKVEKKETPEIEPGKDYTLTLGAYEWFNEGSNWTSSMTLYVWRLGDRSRARTPGVKISLDEKDPKVADLSVKIERENCRDTTNVPFGIFNYCDFKITVSPMERNP